MTTGVDRTVGVVITRHVREHDAAGFEAGVRKAIRAASKQPGWISVEVLCQPLTATHREYNIVHRFSDEERSRAWETSDARRELLARVDTLAADTDRQELTGMEAWFALPAGAAPPARWRMALLTWVGIWPPVTLVIGLIAPHLAALPLAARTALIATILVTTMTYLAMPLLISAAHRWL